MFLAIGMGLIKRKEKVTENTNLFMTGNTWNTIWIEVGAKLVTVDAKLWKEEI